MAKAKLIGDYKPEEEEAVIRLAREEWNRLRGTPRRRLHLRSDLGCHHVKPKCKKRSEAGWLRKRDACVRKGVAKQGGTVGGGSSAGLPDEEFPDEAQQELRWQKQQQRKRRAEALRAGVLLPHEAGRGGGG